MKVSGPKCYRYVDLEKAVYLSNATSIKCEGCLNSEGDVYFDKVKIKFTRGNLKEEAHYYPFGLPMAGIGSSAMGMTPNRQKYQSNEYITDAGLNWMSFGARQYDPQLGRFLSVDPMASAGGQDMLSPYQAMGNNPVSLVDPGGMQAFKDAATQNMMQFNPNAGMPSVTNGYYTPAINTSGWGWIGQWIQTVGNGEEALAEAFGQTARDNYDATTGNQNNNTSSVAGNYKNNGGNNGAASTGQGGGIPTMVNAEGETVAVNGSFNHEAELNPSATFMGTTSIEGSYYRSSYSSSNWSRYLQGASFIFSNSTAIPGAGVGFVTGTKAGKLLSLGGSYVWKSSSYSAQRELVREMAVGSDAIKSAGAVVGIVSIGITATNVIVNQQLNASNMLDVGVTALSFIPVVGWMIGLGYFTADMITLGVTGESIGQHLDNAVGHPVYDWK